MGQQILLIGLDMVKLQIHQRMEPFSKKVYYSKNVRRNHKGKAMSISVATVTSKGQITMPIAIRNALGVRPGDRIQFIEMGPGQFEMLVANNDVNALKDMIKTDCQVSIEEMNEAIASRGKDS